MIDYQDATVTLHHGDCLDVLRELPDNSVDAVCTDPPYGLANTDPAHVAETITRWVNGERDYLPGGAGFMGKAWDAFVPPVAVWDDCLRVLKPGGHVLAFAGSRTVDLMTLGLRLAGFDIRDSIAWLYGSGFPKSLDVSKAIDKAAGAERVGLGVVKGAASSRTESLGVFAPEYEATAPATDAARTWQGWGTALKPAHEPLVVGRKPEGLGLILARIGSQLEALEEACRQRVSGAARSSAPTCHDLPEARTGSAPASAATPHEGEPARTTRTGAAAGSFGATATSASAWTDETFLSIVTSWRACWAELCDLTSTSTTSTTTSRTTDLQTLSSSLSSIMQGVTARSTLDPERFRSIATAADNLFAASVLSLRSTLALSVAESATAITPHASPDAGGSSPAFEPVVVARKPLSGTVAANVLAHGTGALNVDGCRTATTDNLNGGGYSPGDPTGMWRKGSGGGIGRLPGEFEQPAGRWPANVVLDESQAAALDEQSGESLSRIGKPRGADHGDGWGMTATGAEYDDQGGASRFFYVAKADASERVRVNGTAHPTVKPLALMRWLVRLVTPPGGTVLEPFAGSGTTVEACILEGFRCVAIEREADYLPLIRQRINRRRDPVEAVKAAGEDGGLFDLLDEGGAA